MGYPQRGRVTWLHNPYHVRFSKGERLHNPYCIRAPQHRADNKWCQNFCVFIPHPNSAQTATLNSYICCKFDKQTARSEYQMLLYASKDGARRCWSYVCRRNPNLATSSQIHHHFHRCIHGSFITPLPSTLRTFIKHCSMRGPQH